MRECARPHLVVVVFLCLAAFPASNLPGRSTLLGRVAADVSGSVQTLKHDAARTERIIRAFLDRP